VVLIGVGRYKVLSGLGSVHNNLPALARSLRDERLWGLPPGNCVVVTDPVSATDVLDPIAQAAQEATDTLLLYYAGHGLIDPRRGELHLTLVGSDPQRMYTAVSYDHIRDLLLDSRAARRIVILDCCYSGRALGQMGSAGETVAMEASAEGTYVLAAAAENKTAIAPPGAHFTAFTGELLNIIERGITGKGPLLDLDSIYRELLAVMQAKGYPSPQKRDRNTAGQLTLIRNRAYAPAPAEVFERPAPARRPDSSPAPVRTGPASAPGRTGAAGNHDPTGNSILATLAEIAEELTGIPADEVRMDSDIIEDLNIDSLSMVEIAVGVEDRFNITIPDQSLKDIRTVRDAIELIQKLRR
jgi:peptide/nickel transport system substrate-binding protein